MSEKIRVGIVGFGRMGITHYAILNPHPDVAIRAVAEPSGLVLSMLRKYVSGVQTYESYERMLAAELLDAVVVCTPPSLHEAVVRTAGEKGLHVFAEKPFTTEAAKARELAGLFARKGLVHQVGYVNRFNDVFRSLKKRLEEELIGRVLLFKSQMYSRTITKPTAGKTWRDSRAGGGGATYEVASHAIDLVHFLVGKPDKITGSRLTSIHSRGVEDAVCATLLYRDGRSGTLDVNWSDESYRKPTNRIEVFGEKGKMIADQHSLKIFLKKADAGRGLHEGWNTVYITDVFRPVPFYVRGNEFTAQLYHFIDRIRGRRTDSVCGFDDAADTLDVIASIFRDFETNGTL